MAGKFGYIFRRKHYSNGGVFCTSNSTAYTIDDIIRTFVQGESRSQVYLDYAEPPPIFVQVSAIELDLIAECSRKCQEKVHLYETFAHVPLYAIFFPKSAAHPSLTPYLIVYKCVASVWFAFPTLHE